MNFLLVHGACHDGWCWHAIQRDLEAKGHRVSAPDLPFEGFESDVAHVAALIDGSPEPVVVVGHSYGGLVITAAAHEQPNAAHLVYVAAMVPDQTAQFPVILGEIVTAMADDREILEDGRMLFSESSSRLLYNACSSKIIDKALGHLRPMMFTAPEQPIPETWRDVEATYVLCTQDRAIPLHLQQKMAAHTNRTIEIDTDHSPFFSSTEALLDALTSIPVTAG